MIIKYRTAYGSDSLITAVAVERETKKSVWVNGGRELKDATWNQYFDTWELARDSLLDKANRRIDGAKRQLERAQDVRRKLNEMEAPTE